MNTNDESDPGIEPVEKDSNSHLCSEILDGCQRLLGEVDVLQEFASNNKRYRPIELQRLLSKLKSEAEFLKKFSNTDTHSSEKIANACRSSNFSFYDTTWSIMKTCRGVRSLYHRFYWKPAGPKRSYQNYAEKKQAYVDSKTAYGALVDVVADDGLEWVKICTTSEKNLILEMAKAGLVWGDDSEEEEIELEDEDSGLLKIAKGLLRASKANRIRYKAPHIRVIFTRIRDGCSKDVDRLLNQIRALGITLQTADQMPQVPALTDCLSQIPVEISHGFSTVLLDSFTDVLNLDCTIMIALISDMSHAQIPQRDWFNAYVTYQIEKEKEELFLPNTLWPLISSRKLVCTTECAERLKSIVGTMGSESEKARHRLLMDVPADTTSREERLQEFQKHSTYKVPKDLHLPISVVEVDILAAISKLPKSAGILSKTLSPLNQSMFFYGWVSGNTTVTTNGVRAKEIERAVEEHRCSDGERGPDVWLFSSVRSLVATPRARDDKPTW